DLVGVVADLGDRVECALPRQVRRPGRPAVGGDRDPRLVERADLRVVAARVDVGFDVVSGEPERVHGPGVLVDGDPAGDRVADRGIRGVRVARDDARRGEGLAAVGGDRYVDEVVRAER